MSTSAYRARWRCAVFSGATRSSLSAPMPCRANSASAVARPPSAERPYDFSSRRESGNARSTRAQSATLAGRTLARLLKEPNVTRPRSAEAYGALLPPALLEVARFGALNIHASLLPRWRGAAPIQRALLAGDAQTG